jgi:hypothetical protein
MTFFDEILYYYILYNMGQVNQERDWNLPQALCATEKPLSLAAGARAYNDGHLPVQCLCLLAWAATTVTITTPLGYFDVTAAWLMRPRSLSCRCSLPLAASGHLVRHDFLRRTTCAPATIRRRAAWTIASMLSLRSEALPTNLSAEFNPPPLYITRSARARVPVSGWLPDRSTPPLPCATPGNLTADKTLIRGLGKFFEFLFINDDRDAGAIQVVSTYERYPQ